MKEEQKDSSEEEEEEEKATPFGGSDDDDSTPERPALIHTKGDGEEIHKGLAHFPPHLTNSFPLLFPCLTLSSL